MKTFILFEFGNDVQMLDVKATLHLSKIGAIALHGKDAFIQEVTYSCLESDRCVKIDDSTPTGRCLSLLFGGYVRREFGEESVKVSRR